MRNPGNHITSKHELDLFHQFSTKPNHITACFIECIFIFNSLTCCLKQPWTTAQFSNPKLRFPTSMDSRPHGLLSSFPRIVGVYNHRKDHRRKITWRWMEKYLKRQDVANTFLTKAQLDGWHEWYASGWLAFLPWPKGPIGNGWIFPVACFSSKATVTLSVKVLLLFSSWWF